MSPPKKNNKTEPTPPTSPDGQGPEQDGSGLEAAWHAAGESLAAQTEAADRSELDDADVDPELTTLPVRRGRHPLVSVVVIAFSVYLIHLSWSDFLYFFRSSTPVDLGEVTEAIQGNRLRANTYVTLRGAPDRQHALLLKGRVSGYDSLFRLLLSKGRIYVQRHRSKRSTDRTVHSVHTGRLVPFETLSYADGVREYLRKAVKVNHDIGLQSLARAKRENLSTVDDQQGRSVSLTPETNLWINVAYPGEWVIQFSKKAYPERDRAEAHVRALELPYALDEEASPSMWRFIVIVENEQLAQLMKRFGDPALHAGIVRRQLSYLVQWNALSLDDSHLVIGAAEAPVAARFRLQESSDEKSADSRKLVRVEETPIRVSREAALYVSVQSSFSVPADAMVVLAGERPTDFWLYLLLFAILATFVILNGLVLLRHRRRP